MILKPPVRMRKVALLRSTAREHLGIRGEDELFRAAEVMSEGRVAGDAFFGSTLITIDLGALGLAPEDHARFVRVAEGSVRVRLRAMRLAESDLHRRFPDRSFGTMTSDTRVRLEGARLLIDVDVEVPFLDAGARTA